MNELSKNQLHYLNMRRRHKRIVAVSRVSILLTFLFLWEFSANTGLIDSFIFSSPSRIALCFLEMTGDGSIFRHIGVTLYETLVSFVLVIFFSLFVTVLLWLFRKLSEILEPYLVVLNSLPKSALAPLLIVWLGANRTTIIIAGMSVAIFGSILNLYSEFSEVDPDKIMLIYTLHGNRLHALSKVVIPSCIPAIISTMKVNIGLCLVGVIIGEFIGGREGLGYMIIYGSQVFKLDWLLMSICIMWGMVLSIFFNKRYLGRLGSGKKSSGGAGFGDTAMTAMFIGLVSAYIGSYIGGFVSGGGLFSFSGSFMPLIVVFVSGLVMAGFIYLSEKKNLAWVESFSIAGSMLIGMAAAVVVKLFM